MNRRASLIVASLLTLASVTLLLLWLWWNSGKEQDKQAWAKAIVEASWMPDGLGASGLERMDPCATSTKVASLSWLSEEGDSPPTPEKFRDVEARLAAQGWLPAETQSDGAIFSKNIDGRAFELDLITSSGGADDERQRASLVMYPEFCGP